MALAKIEYQCVIKSVLQIMCQLHIDPQMHRRSVWKRPSYSIIVKWMNDFKCTPESHEDEPMSAWLADTANPQTVGQVEALIIEDCCVKIAKISI